MSDPIEPDGPNSPDMSTIEIATTDGDVLLVLEETRLRVSSVILSSASLVFKTMLGPNFLEVQGNRSAHDPKEIPLLDDDVIVMTRLCRLLHHQRELPNSSPPGVPFSDISTALIIDARALFDLAVLADKYGCAESIQMAVGYLFFELGSRLKASDVSTIVQLNLIAAAYIFEDRRHFALFTRRLVMDHFRAYSRTCSHHPALAILPTSFLLIVEEQRKAVWRLFHDELPKLATKECTAYRTCNQAGTDYNFLPALVAKLPNHRVVNPVSWPPSDRPLRYILRETYNCGGSIACRAGCGHADSVKSWDVTCEDLKALCDRVNKAALGLCLLCLPSPHVVPGDCPYHLLERWVENDPLV